jgi:putative transcriptional regulator
MSTNCLKTRLLCGLEGCTPSYKIIKYGKYVTTRKAAARMQWRNTPESQRFTTLFSLRDLRAAKGASQAQLAKVLKISKALYHAIEHGQRKPGLDTAYKLAVIYGCSMDFIYHAFYRQHYIWYFPEADLEYSMREAKAMDIQYLKSRQPPAAPPDIPAAVIWERDAGLELDSGNAGDYDNSDTIRPYGLDRNLL